MTKVASSGKIVTSIMTLELLESTELIFNLYYFIIFVTLACSKGVTILTFGVFTGLGLGFQERGFICIKVLGSLF